MGSRRAHKVSWESLERKPINVRNCAFSHTPDVHIVIPRQHESFAAYLPPPRWIERACETGAQVQLQTLEGSHTQEPNTHTYTSDNRTQWSTCPRYTQSQLGVFVPRCSSLHASCPFTFSGACISVWIPPISFFFFLSLPLSLSFIRKNAKKTAITVETNTKRVSF